MRSFLRKAFLIFPWLLVALTVGYLWFFDGLRDVVTGRFIRQAHGFFARSEEITEARIYLLMGDEAQRTQENFPIRPYETEAPIYGSLTLSSTDLNAFSKTWLKQEATPFAAGACHRPAYGVRLYRGNRMVAETSLCWECNSYAVDIYPFLWTWCGFNCKGERGQELLQFLDQRLPYKRPPPKTAKPAASP